MSGVMLRGLKVLALASLAGLVLAPSAFAEGDPLHGKTVFARCAGCHAISGPSFAAPALAGVVGRKAGSAPGFQYSKALVAYGKVWDDQALDAFIAAPTKAVPGTSMPIGLDGAQDRADVIAYLKSVPAAH